LDVAYPPSEAAHHFEVEPGERGTEIVSFLRRGVTSDETEILDGGRVLYGAARFALARDPVAPALVVVRTVGGGAERWRIRVDGGPSREVEVPRAAAAAFREVIVGEIAPGSGNAQVMLVAVREVGDAPLSLCHVFALAEPTR
jgi:hypothetical protein